MRTRRAFVVSAIALTLVLACVASRSAHANDASGFGRYDSGSSFSPLVPVSAFARPASWLDPSRLHISTTVSVGTGFNGGTDGLQVTSLAYQLGAPLAVRVSVANAFGASALEHGNGMFLEGFQVAYRPTSTMQFNIDYRNIRSPLQYSNYPGFGTFGR